jgi:DNA polymerase III subunit epsilon
MRQIILDTETTGLRVEDGHRLIEIGCLEMINRRLTNERFHFYINPKREVEAGAFAVHGISTEFLLDKPLFSEVADQLISFISGAELIIHNAPFDVSFLDHELMLAKRGYQSIADYCQVIDTLQMARQLHVGQRNSLDALCKRYSVDNSKRDLHGALVDAYLLAQVYLAMTGGQGSFFDAAAEQTANTDTQSNHSQSLPSQTFAVVVQGATPEEIKAHEAYLAAMKKKGECLWLEESGQSGL